jgi:hypothetical protein
MTQLKYVGQGTYIHGVPARDLTDEEAARFEAVIREQEALTGTVLYEPAASAMAEAEATAAMTRAIMVFICFLLKN